LWQVISVEFPIFAIVLLGFLYARRHSPDMAAANKLNIYVFVPTAVVLFIIENTLHLSVSMKMLDHDNSLLSMLKIPILLATLAGLAISSMHYSVSTLLVTPIHMLGQIVPLR